MLSLIRSCDSLVKPVICLLLCVLTAGCPGRAKNKEVKEKQYLFEEICIISLIKNVLM